LTQGIGLRPQPWAGFSRPVGPATGSDKRLLAPLRGFGSWLAPDPGAHAPGDRPPPPPESPEGAPADRRSRRRHNPKHSRPLEGTPPAGKPTDTSPELVGRHDWHGFWRAV